MHNQMVSIFAQIATVFGAIDNAPRAQARYSDLQRSARDRHMLIDGSELVRKAFGEA